MLARLGNVLYWAGCLLAGIVLLFGVTIFVERMSRYHDWTALGFCTTVAVAFWLIGRACKYVLAGK